MFTGRPPHWYAARSAMSTADALLDDANDLRDARRLQHNITVTRV